MPKNYTENYHLNQWEPEDQVLRTDFNTDNLAIDAAIKAVDEKADGLAKSKADAAALADLSGTVAAHAAALAKCGNCKIWTTTYTGTGTHGKDGPTKLPFPKKPLMALVTGTSGKASWLLPRDGSFWAAETDTINVLTWSGSTASSYTTYTGNFAEDYQMNSARITYYVVALLAADG